MFNIKIKLFFLVYIFFFLTHSDSVADIIKYASPEIKNYPPYEYGGETQTWGIAEDKYGKKYFANNYGVIIYDGINWEHVTLPSNKSARSITSDKNGNIIVGSRGEFGYISNDGKGRSVFVSLNKYIKDIEYKSDDPVYETFYLNDGSLFFRTKKKLFIYKNKNFRIINAPKNNFFGVSHLINNQLYIFIKKKGLYKLSQSNFAFNLVPGTKQFSTKEKEIMGLIKHENNLILFTRNKGIYKLKDKKITKISYKNNLINDTSIYRARKLKNNKIALATYDGIFLLNNKLNIEKHFNIDSGLRVNNVRSLFEDDQGLIWVGLNDGIAKINLNSRFQYFFKNESGIKANVLDVEIFKDKLYLGTSMGLRKLITDENNLRQSFHALYEDKIKTQVWDLLALDKQLYIASNFGFGYLNNDNENYYPLIDKQETGNVYKIRNSELIDKGFLIGTSKGLFVANINTLDSKENIQYIELKSSEGNNLKLGIGGDIIEIQADDEIWLTVKEKGLYRIKLEDKNFESLKVTTTRFDRSHGLPDLRSLKPFNLDGKLMIGTSKGIYKYIKSDNTFSLDKTFEVIPNIKNKEFRNISKSKQKNIYWINFVERKNGKRHQEFYQIREKDFKIKKLSFEKMNKFMSAKSKHFDNFAIVYGNEGLAIINYVKKNIAKNGYTILSKIKNNKETIYNFGTETSYIGEKFNIKNQFEYNQNNFKFFVSATNFIDEKKNKFRHTLQNYDEFSNFSSINSISYTNLGPGHYTLVVESIIYNNDKLIPYEYSFQIKKPWWQTYQFYISEVIFLLFLLFLTVFSKRSKKSEKIATALTLILILIVFEYVNFILDPFFYNLTGGIPIFTILSKVLLGLLLLPVEGITSKALDFMSFRILQKQ